ncbi:cytochrome c oxidase assembly protein COX19-like [Scaptodrosophila lebanonensis]|uniref:Cytochrome c oxidase assembly protein COX19 n=1 Tax=Drosophila lebanonensis TaxID=7225 RepID=A0A6J2U8F2_DROLE|nr:cytochrome c oxidase assembly protein COX19-like [Scaptodrosophila lebanonensis]XP_030384619.1 cytochrome c oxidase assembly protein COX19-like [Scaptodrosophila lebanonensis]
MYDMSSQVFGQKKFIPTAPEKGSFPLDHAGVCKKQFLLYTMCLRRNENDNAKCRLQVKDYLGCRMDNELMERTSWSKLGFPEKSVAQQQTEGKEDNKKELQNKNLEQNN